MKPIIVLSACVLGLGGIGALIWSNRSDESEQASLTGDGVTSSKTDYSTAKTLPGFSSRREESKPNYKSSDLEPLYPLLELESAGIKEGQRVADLSPEELRKLEADHDKIGELVALQNQRQFELQLAKLAEELALDSSQQEALRARLAEIQGEIEAGNLQAYGELTELLRGEGLEEVLGAEQWAKHQSNLEQKAFEAVEKQVAVEVNEVRSLLNLNARQSEQVAVVLQDYGLEQQRTQNQQQSEEELIRLGEEFKAALSQVEEGSNPLEAIIKQTLNTAREEKLSRLAGILNEEQIDAYRQSLELRDRDLSRFQRSLNAIGQR